MAGCVADQHRSFTRLDRAVLQPPHGGP